MAVTVKPVVGLGTRVSRLGEWVAIDQCGPDGDANAQQDTAKSKEITFCGINRNGPCTIHVGVFNRAAFSGGVLTTEINPPSIMLFLHYNVAIALGVTFSIKDVYMDSFYSVCQNMGQEPVVAVYVANGSELPVGGAHLDVIQRR